MSEEKFCSKCGSALGVGAEFCSKCGTPVTHGSAQPPPPPPFRREYRGEKEEKHEKHEKEEKGEKHEKGGDRTGVVIGGLILIWLGVSFYLTHTGMMMGGRWWAYFLAGLGVIIIFQGLLRYSQTRYLPHLTGPLMGGLILSIIGLAFIGGVSDVWPIILVVIGIAIIVSSLTARMRAPRP